MNENSGDMIAYAKDTAIVAESKCACCARRAGRCACPGKHCEPNGWLCDRARAYRFAEFKRATDRLPFVGEAAPTGENGIMKSAMPHKFILIKTRALRTKIGVDLTRQCVACGLTETHTVWASDIHKQKDWLYTTPMDAALADTCAG